MIYGSYNLSQESLIISTIGRFDILSCDNTHISSQEAIDFMGHLIKLQMT